MQITLLYQVTYKISGNGYGGQNLNRYPGHSPLRCLSGWPHKLCAFGSSFPNARRLGTPSWLHMVPGPTHVHVAIPSVPSNPALTNPMIGVRCPISGIGWRSDAQHDLSGVLGQLGYVMASGRKQLSGIGSWPAAQVHNLRLLSAVI